MPIGGEVTKICTKYRLLALRNQWHFIQVKRCELANSVGVFATFLAIKLMQKSSCFRFAQLLAQRRVCKHIYDPHNVFGKKFLVSCEEECFSAADSAYGSQKSKILGKIPFD